MITNLENDKDIILFNMFMKSNISTKENYLKDIKNKEVNFKFEYGDIPVKYVIIIENSKIKHELLLIKTTKKWSKIIERNCEIARYKTCSTGRCSNITTINEYELSINKLINMDVEYLNEYINNIINFSDNYSIYNKLNYEFEFINKYSNNKFIKNIYTNRYVENLYN